MQSLKEQAIELRLQGYSYSLIRDKLGVSISTMSYWLRDIPFTPNQEVEKRIKDAVKRVGIQRNHQRVAQTANLRAQGMREVGELSERDIWMLGIGLYIGEGSKSIESVRIVNSDPLIIKLAMRWFREACKLSDDNIRLRIFMYPDTNEIKAIKYWQAITGIPVANFRKTMIDQRVGKSRKNNGKLPYGTLQIQIISNGDPTKGVQLFRKVNGWMAGAMNNKQHAGVV